MLPPLSRLGGSIAPPYARRHAPGNHTWRRVFGRTSATMGNGRLDPPRARVLVLMGVAGSGKTTLGKWLAEHWQCAFLDADDHHSPECIQKMAASIPLSDEDRHAWASQIRSKIDEFLVEPRSAVVACSALGENTRSQLGIERPEIALVHLVASQRTLRKRLEKRKGHFFPASLLESQLDRLDLPDQAITISSEAPVEAVANMICEYLSLA